MGATDKKTYVISGGNSGIGLEAARQLVALGNYVVLLGRDATKGAAAVQLLGGGSAAEFHAVDLSTHAGVRSAAEKVAAKHSMIDGLILGAGTLTLKEQRTADGLHPVFSVNYLSRYHLTQRLLPQLRAGNATVVILVAGVPLNSKVDFALFPKFDPFPGMSKLSSIQIANHHYVAHLAKSEPNIRAAVINVGIVATEIMRDMPLLMRLAFPVVALFVAIPVERAAANATWLSTHGSWPSGHYWGKPGKADLHEALALDTAVTEKVVAISKELTGA